MTIGQYLRPSLAHIPVSHYWSPTKFNDFAEIAKGLGFKKVNSGPLVRSSYHANQTLDLPLRLVWGGAGAFMVGNCEKVFDRSYQSWSE